MKMSVNFAKFVAALMAVCIGLNMLMMFYNMGEGRYNVAGLNVLAALLCWFGIPTVREEPQKDERWYK